MKKTLNDYDFNEKTVLLRVDFNVPLDDNGMLLHMGGETYIIASVGKRV